MAASDFEWERPLIELEERIRELQNFTDQQGIDLSDEITSLKRRADQLRHEIFANLTPWQRVLLVRHPRRPTTLDFIEWIFDEFVELHGDRTHRDDAAMVGGIARLNGRPVTVIGPQKGRDTKENIRRNFGLPHPEGYRKAMRLMKQAERFGRPIITLIDVVGAYPGIEAEQRGQGLVIAEAILAMSELRVPIVSVITGEGGSGGALAIGVGDRVWMLENAWYSVISPEMCAQILWKDTKRAAEAAEVLRLTARDLLELGVVEGIVPEPMGGAHRDPEATARNLKEVLVRELAALEGSDPDGLVEARHQRYRRLGRLSEGHPGILPGAPAEGEGETPGGDDEEEDEPSGQAAWTGGLPADVPSRE
ncbi:acetyl-CoA carboxylase carboxyltransferase subunit alpha [Limnochorda pilosa]|uniref:Acetyl-coenzyme A carboxylase carboxyl transferase subunit alpha n=1 Tax=Limnochorda pilosa TaxID=1555112 RepID=A0A0K2SJJ9_LIMPI|nr:acetyl-CoA carboxylase carboxyltransferase subunit alpha [Limnochorda pilosa]BAS27288.1 acetyl-CoA carboxylase subunit alpha [Limnochorda pilosa]